MFKSQISLGCHNAGLKFNYCLRFDPRKFLLPSTFNNLLKRRFLNRFACLKRLLIWLTDERGLATTIVITTHYTEEAMQAHRVGKLKNSGK
jgi:hypothetical protein